MTDRVTETALYVAAHENVFAVGVGAGDHEIVVQQEETGQPITTARDILKVLNERVYVDEMLELMGDVMDDPAFLLGAVKGAIDQIRSDD